MNGTNATSALSRRQFIGAGLTAAGGVAAGIGPANALPVARQAFSFSPPRRYAAGNLPAGIVVADFNRDGHEDLAVADSSSDPVGAIKIFLGKGDGTFEAGGTFKVGACPVAMAVGDFDHDGYLDLAVGNDCPSPKPLSILLGNGDGTFQPERRFDCGREPFAVAAADFNGDGNLDLAIANGNNNTVSILLGNGDGTFQPRKIIPVPNSPFSLALGDFNGDGHVDIVTANYSFYVSPGTVSVLLGRGDGTFERRKEYPAGQHPYDVAVGDLNGDGNEDLAVVDYDRHLVQVLLGRGDGSFARPKGYITCLNPFKVVIADFNRDGQVDLAASDWGMNAVSVLPGLGSGVFGKPQNFHVGPGPEYFAVGDFNGDKRPDLAVPLFYNNQIAILLNTTP